MKRPKIAITVGNFHQKIQITCPCQKLTILPQTIGLHFNFQMKEAYIFILHNLSKIVDSTTFKGCLRSPRTAYYRAHCVQKVHQRLRGIILILGRLSLQQQFRSGKRMSVCQMVQYHQMYKIATISCKGKEKILEQGHTMTKLKKSK